MAGLGVTAWSLYPESKVRGLNPRADIRPRHGPTPGQLQVAIHPCLDFLGPFAYRLYTYTQGVSRCGFFILGQRERALATSGVGALIVVALEGWVHGARPDDRQGMYAAPIGNEEPGGSGGQRLEEGASVHDSSKEGGEGHPVKDGVYYPSSRRVSKMPGGPPSVGVAVNRVLPPGHARRVPRESILTTFIFLRGVDH